MEKKSKELFSFGDKLTFNYKAKILENDNNLTKENVSLVLGENTFLPNFDLFFLFKPIEESFEVEYKFSSLYSEKKLAGKTAEFKIYVTKIEKQPDLGAVIEEKFKNIVDFYSKSRKIKLLRGSKNFEEKLKEKEDLLLNLEKKTIELTLDNQKNLEDFNIKAKTLAKKAEEELEKFKKQQKEYLEKDFKEKQMYSFQKLFEEIIGPLNNFKLAIDAGVKQENSAINSYVRGFDMLLNQIHNILDKQGLKIIEPTIGEEFNPEIHHAVETKEGENPNTILKINSPGYKFHNRVIKPALVIVAK